MSFCGNAATNCEYYFEGTCRKDRFKCSKQIQYAYVSRYSIPALDSVLLYNGKILANQEKILENQEKILRKLNELQK